MDGTGSVTGSGPARPAGLLRPDARHPTL